MEQEHQPLSLRALVDESLDMVVVQARDKGLNLAFTWLVPETRGEARMPASLSNERI